MRIKVLLSTMFVALLVLLPLIYLRNKSSFPPPVQRSDTSLAQPTAAPAAAPRMIAAVRAAGAPPSENEKTADLPPAEHQAYVSQRKAELLQMGMSDDPAALKTILGELSNRDPEIRQTALTATIDFGSQDAIPFLRNQLAWTDDPQEKIEIQKAIDFLQLPPARPNGDAAPVTQQRGDQPAAAESH